MANLQIIDSWIARSRFNSNKTLRLFCFPYAGGGTSIFSSWSTILSADVEICPIELPGHGYRIAQHPFDRLEPLVNELVYNLLPYLDKPFAFFGHSMGGLISFELAHLLRKCWGIYPLHLFISGRRAPQIPKSKPIHHLPESEFVDELRSLKGTPEAVLENAELMRLFLPILRSDFAVLDNYIYTSKPLLNFPITVLGGLEDFENTCEDLEAWRKQTTADFSVQMFQGDHFFIHSAREPLLQFLNQELKILVRKIGELKKVGKDEL